jgi:hypothetical protein
VDPLNGSDNNDGFSVSTAMKNPTTCYYRALADFDFNSNDPAETCDIINDSVDNTSGCMHLSADGFVGAQGGAQFIFDGFDPVNAVNRKLTCTGNAPFQVFLYTDINMRRITLSSDAACITAGYKSIVNILDGVIFNGCGTTGAIVISEDALVFITNDITINSPYAYFINSAGGRITTGVVTIHGGSNAGTTFVGSSTNGTVDLRAVSFSGFAFTGQHCSAASGGRVLTVTGNADTDLPGTTISTTSNGGWCGNQSLGAGVTSFLKQATYDLTTASGTQALTGFGFKPSACHFKGTVIGSAVGSYTTYGGDVDSAGNQSAVYAGGGATNTYDNSSVMVAVNAAATATQVAKVQSFDTDGLTLSWTKVSTPTVGTFNFSAMCLK